MSLDVLCREVHEKIEGVGSINGKFIGLYGGGVFSIWVIILCEWVHQENWFHTKGSGFGGRIGWGEKGRGSSPNEWKMTHDKD